jgi:hypothetical protein
MAWTNGQSTGARRTQACTWIITLTLSACSEEPAPAARRPSRVTPPPEELPFVEPPPPTEPLSCSLFHAEGWRMDCTEYVPGGAFLREGRWVAERACSIGEGTLSASGCPTDGSLGRCRDADFVLFYYASPHETPTRAELRETCEGNGGVFEEP